MTQTKFDFSYLRSLWEKSTRVTQWKAHPGTDCYGPEASVRGPFFRWFKVTPVEPEYQRYVSNDLADAEYCAAAMNALPGLMDRCEELGAEVDLARERLGPAGYKILELANENEKRLTATTRMIEERDAVLDVARLLVNDAITDNMHKNRANLEKLALALEALDRLRNEGAQ